MSVAEFRRLFLIGAGFDVSKIPPTMDEETWRELSLQALAGIGGGGSTTLASITDMSADARMLNAKTLAAMKSDLGIGAPTALAPAANVLFGVVAGAGVTVLPASPAFGAKAEYVITPTGADRNLKITTAILKPSNSSFDRAVGVTLPVGKPSIVMFKCVDEAGTWMLISNVGGGE